MGCEFKCQNFGEKKILNNSQKFFLQKKVAQKSIWATFFVKFTNFAEKSRPKDSLGDFFCEIYVKSSRNFVKFCQKFGQILSNLVKFCQIYSKFCQNSDIFLQNPVSGPLKRHDGG